MSQEAPPEYNQTALVESLESRDGIRDILTVGPIVFASSTRRNEAIFTKGSINYGYRVGMVIHDPYRVLYVPMNWTNGGSDDE